jgi:light-regulated signal transduction histidine kinase (bacteriophytochrome)
MDIQDKTKVELQKELTELQRNFNYLDLLKDIDTAKRMQLEQELAAAHQEIAFLNEEKGKRAAELIIANLELKFETEEKAKRAAELVIANIELVFQNEEKEKRAAELIIANNELAFQNGEKVKRAKELENANRDLEQFAYVASHDLQEPLRMISSYTQLLERKYKDQLDQDANDYIHFVVDGAIRMQKLLINLLDFSRVTTRSKPFEQVDTKTIAGQAISNLQQLIRENTALITNDDLPVIQADEMQILQVFQNLIENAIKFKKKTELLKIHITCTKQHEMYQFSVADNGIGIEMQYHDRVFIVFQRLHSAKDYPGTGIGLSICKRIIERHGGTIWFESTVNEGTTFYFTIPV